MVTSAIDALAQLMLITGSPDTFATKARSGCLGSRTGRETDRLSEQGGRPLGSNLRQAAASLLGASEQRPSRRCRGCTPKPPEFDSTIAHMSMRAMRAFFALS